MISKYSSISSLSESEFNDLYVFGELSLTVDYSAKAPLRDCENARNAAIFNASVEYAVCTAGAAGVGIICWGCAIAMEIACTNMFCYNINEAQWDYSAYKNNH